MKGFSRKLIQRWKKNPYFYNNRYTRYYPGFFYKVEPFPYARKVTKSSRPYKGGRRIKYGYKFSNEPKILNDQWVLNLRPTSPI